MSTAVALDPTRSVLDQLRDRVSAMQDGPTRLPVPTLPGIADLVSLRTGGAYGVDSASLALALSAGASAAGEWVGFAGWTDFGAEAAAGLGIDLARVVLVPDLGDHWLEVTAALVDVLKVVVLRPPADVDPRSASLIEARLRSRSSVLVVWGAWPRCEARVSLESAAWEGAEAGHGRLHSRRVRLSVSRGVGEEPPRRRDLWFPGESVAMASVAAGRSVEQGDVPREAWVASG